ncbi:MAG: SpaH/EbpB family LPXTG-anchored major pilin [Leucobacter sp.]|nr:SpaH/EbpB family LPXTG-anchored major pilin [Leucobacter sp.]
MTLLTLPTPGGRARVALGFVAALVAALLLGGLTSQQAHAAGAVMPEGPKTLVIHPGQQPDPNAGPATGLPLPGASSPAGHEFEVKRVPGVDIGSASGWNAAVAMTPEEGAARVAGEPAAGPAAVAADGSIVFNGLETGLYYVEETAAPTGSMRSAPFLVTLPLPHPTEAGEWLTTVHVYPKSAGVEVSLVVRDRDAVTCGDTVSWTAIAAVPAIDSLDSFRVRHLLAPDMQIAGGPTDITVAISGDAALEPDTDFTAASAGSGGRAGVEVVFTRAGLDKLLLAAPTEVRVGYDTSVPAAGEFTAETELFVGGAAPVRADATTKLGPLRVLAHERGNERNRVAGVGVSLFARGADAQAGNAPLTVGGARQFQTDTDGLVTFACLRLSNFADGLDRELRDPLFRNYFAAPVAYPAGWTGDGASPVGTVSSVTEAETLRIELWKVAGPPPLPETGARISGTLLLGGLLLVAGAAALRRRRSGEAAQR